jgi:hypothetical protein
MQAEAVMKMQQEPPEKIVISGETYQLPITLRRSEPKLKRLPGLLLMAMLAALIVIPQIGLAIYALASPELRAALAANPIAAVELAVAFAFWAALVCWPLRNIIVAMASDRMIDIRNGEVMVIDRTPFSSHGWRMPLATYNGVRVRLRTSLSSIQQDVVLEHPDPRRSVILATAAQIGKGEILELSRILGVPLLLSGDTAGTSGPSGGHKFDADLAPAGA